MKTILIICFSNLARDPRVNRQIRFLKDHFRVITAGIGDPKIKGVQYIDCKVTEKKLLKKIMDGSAQIDITNLMLKRYETFYWRQKKIRNCLEKLHGIKPDVIIGNDIDTLPLALKIADGAKVILDVHEYAPREFEDILRWRLCIQGFKKYLCKRYIPEVDVMMTVCQGIADEYEKNYGVKPFVITNAPDYEYIEPHTTNPQQIRIIYHGVAGISRKIEDIVKIMDYVDDRFELDFILIPGSKQYIEKIKKLAQHNSRIRFIPPVPMHELVRFSSQYDIGLFLLEPTNFNYLHALPNKFFEFIQARLAIAIGPSPEMARIVKKYDCGVVADDFYPQTLAHCLMELDEKKIDYYKGQSHKIARIMSSEENEKKMLKLIDVVSKR